MTKFCKDCRWSIDLGDTPRNPAHHWACGNEKLGSRIDVVDGERIYIDCHKARERDVEKPCGFEGKLWEPRSGKS